MAGVPGVGAASGCLRALAGPVGWVIGGVLAVWFAGSLGIVFLILAGIAWFLNRFIFRTHEVDYTLTQVDGTHGRRIRKWKETEPVNPNHRIPRRICNWGTWICIGLSILIAAVRIKSGSATREALEALPTRTTTASDPQTVRRVAPAPTEQTFKIVLRGEEPSEEFNMFQRIPAGWDYWVSGPADGRILFSDGTSCGVNEPFSPEGNGVIRFTGPAGREVSVRIAPHR